MRVSVLDSEESGFLLDSAGPAVDPCGKTGYPEAASKMEVTL